MTIFFDGYVYKQIEIEKYTELYVFKYNKLHSTSITIYGNDSGVARSDDMIYYKRILTDEEIANISPKAVTLGCLNDNDRTHQYIIPENYNNWKLCQSIPINCTLDFGDGYRQTNGTNLHQYYTANFSKDYTRYGQYTVCVRFYN
ncbi:unnamed protein product [Adineta steineri]|uniref:Uncharacterized protein n=1 Tax=Adineta steineri TaxID=433720 RepID=A0A815CK89_9BILA|nr:unnamed protein product [Adineta steineri]